MYISLPFSSLPLPRAVNAGKSKRNEDAAAVYTGVLHQPSPGGGGGPAGDADGSPPPPTGRSVPYYYFGLFDGHAGYGASVAAANQLHHIIHVRERARGEEEREGGGRGREGREKMSSMSMCSETPIFQTCFLTEPCSRRCGRCGSRGQVGGA